jgi:glycine betaine/proline transport system permease protein
MPAHLPGPHVHERRKALTYHIVAGGLLLLVLVIYRLSTENSVFPAFLHYALREPVDVFADWLPETFRFILKPISDAVKLSLKALDRFFLGLPWPVVVLGVFLLTQHLGGLRLSLLSAGSLLFMGVTGLWDASLITLTIMTISVAITVIIGIPLGIWTARSDRVEMIMRPVLDAMQTMPAFVYLLPVMLLFGIGATSAVMATIIYAAPPVIRLTNLGIRQVPTEVVEAATSYGSTPLQILFKAQLPLAKPSIIMGINQTVMMALGMVIFVALIGASGLGKEIWFAMRRLHIGLALEAGLAVVLMAIVMDRISYALTDRERESKPRAYEAEPAGMLARMKKSVARIGAFAQVLSHAFATGMAVLIGCVAQQFTRKDVTGILRRVFTAHAFLLASSLLLLTLILVNRYLVDFGEFPAAWIFHFAKPVDAAAAWMNISLAFITDPMRKAIFVYGLGPMRDFLIWLPWPVLMLGIAYLAWQVAGWRIALLSLFGFTFIGVTGMWVPTMVTLSQVLVALILSVVIAVPIGILASRSDGFEALIRPVLDAMQTLPAFVYFPVVIMLFRIGDLSGIIATVIYAMPPAIRLTNLGIRQVSAEVIEAARSYGSTPRQILFKVQLPLALPSIMMGINQTTMMALAMVIYAALIGARGLGAEVLLSIGRFDVGAGFEAGMSIVILAVIADRITQGWAKGRQQALGVVTSQ